MRKVLACVLSGVVLLSSSQAVSAAQKPCTKTQLSKLYKLAIEFNDNRTYLLEFALNVDRSVKGLVKSHSEADTNAENLYWENYRVATAEAKKLITIEKSILKSIKSAFNCSGYGTDVDPKYGFMDITNKSKTKMWPADIGLAAAPVFDSPKVSTQLSPKEASDCSVRYGNRIYVGYKSLKQDYFSPMIHEFENLSDCVVQANISFTVLCPAVGSTTSNPNFPHPVTFEGGLKLAPREKREISEYGFAPNVLQQCYQVTRKSPNDVKFENSPPKITITYIGSK